MNVPVKDIIYSIWNPLTHEVVLNTPIKKEAIRVYEQHALRSILQVWKIVTTEEGYNEHIKLR
jgi:hypothetical protein